LILLQSSHCNQLNGFKQKLNLILTYPNLIISQTELEKQKDHLLYFILREVRTIVVCATYVKKNVPYQLLMLFQGTLKENYALCVCIV